MKRTHYIRLLVYTFFLIISVYSYGFNEIYTFNLDDFKLNNQNGVMHIMPLSRSYTFDYCSVGYPLIPFCEFKVPAKSNNDEIKYEIIEKERIASDVILDTCSSSAWFGKKLYDLTIENNRMPKSNIPDRQIHYYNGVLYGDDKATISITPFIYDTTERNLYFIKQIQISYNDIEPSLQGLKMGAGHTSLDRFDYLIITQDSLVDTFERLRYWKTIKGIRTRIAPMSSIDGSHDGVVTVNEIKDYIHNCFTHNCISMVLLGGSSEIVPSPIFTMYLPGGYGEDSEYRNVPTDMYYACFDGSPTWNGDGDNIFGEWLEDNIDYFQDVSITRLPIRTRSELNSYINKLIAYERYPDMAGDSVRWLLAGDSLHWCDSNARSDAQIDSEAMIGYLSGSQVSHQMFVDTKNTFNRHGMDSIVNAVNISEVINEYRPHWMNMDCHGSIDGWSFDVHDFTDDFTNSDAESLDNEGLPMIITTAACNTANFSLHQYCLAESFLNHPSGGALTYLGSAYEGWGTLNGSSTLGPAMTIASFFWNSLYYADNHFGNAARLAKNAKANATSLNNTTGFKYDWQLRNMNALGDCEVPIYTERPHMFSGIKIVVDYENILLEQIDINEDWHAAYVSKEDHGATYFLADDRLTQADFISPVPCTICLTKKNYIPYVAESGRYVGNASQNDLYLQNITFNGNIMVYQADNNVYIGNDVDSLSEEGDVIIEAGSTVYIDFEDKAVIRSGFTCKKGGKFGFNYNY